MPYSFWRSMEILKSKSWLTKNPIALRSKEVRCFLNQMYTNWDWGIDGRKNPRVTFSWQELYSLHYSFPPHKTQQKGIKAWKIFSTKLPCLLLFYLLHWERIMRLKFWGHTSSSYILLKRLSENRGLKLEDTSRPLKSCLPLEASGQALGVIMVAQIMIYQ